MHVCCLVGLTIVCCLVATPAQSVDMHSLTHAHTWGMNPCTQPRAIRPQRGLRWRASDVYPSALQSALVAGGSRKCTGVSLEMVSRAVDHSRSRSSGQSPNVRVQGSLTPTADPGSGTDSCQHRWCDRHSVLREGFRACDGWVHHASPTLVSTLSRTCTPGLCTSRSLRDRVSAF